MGVGNQLKINYFCAVLNTLTTEYRALWKCAICIGEQPKIGNIITPVRHVADGITIRRNTEIVTSPPDQMDVSLLDTTLNN